MSAPLPIDSYRSGDPDLGPLEATYGPAFRGAKAFWWIVRTAVFCIWALLGLRGNPLAPGGWLLAAVAFVHVLIVWDFRRNADIEVRLHRDGIRVHRAGRWRAIAWDDITAYTTRVDRVGRSVLTMNWWSDVARMRVIIATRTGELELASALDGLLKVGARIRSESLSRLRRWARTELDAGNAMSFGRLSLDRAGVHRDGRTLPWNDLTSVAVDRGDIVVRSKSGTWSRDPYPGTPNAHVFVDLLERRIKKQAA